jgi:hypothetical protein
MRRSDRIYPAARVLAGLRALIPLTLILSDEVRAGEAPKNNTEAKADAADPTASSPFNLGSSQVVLSASKADKVAKGRLALSLGQSVLNLTVAAPLSESDDDTTLVTSEGLTDQASAELGLSHFFWTTTPIDAHQEEICEKYRRDLSLADLSKKYPGPTFAKKANSVEWPQLLRVLHARKEKTPAAAVRDLVSDGVREIVDRLDPDLPMRQAEAEAILGALDKLLSEKTLSEKLKVSESDRRKALVEALRSDVVEGDEAGLKMRNRLLLEAALGGGVRTYPDPSTSFGCGKDLPGSYEADFRRPGGIPVITFAKVKAGQKTYKFMTKNTFDPDQLNHTTAQGSLGVGIITRTGEFLGLSYRHASTYKAGKARQICVPVGTSTATECRTLPVGAPARSDEDAIQVEARKFLGLRLALNPKLSYEFGGRVTIGELAVYFLPTADGRLAGGVTGSFSTETHSASATFFVGLPLDLGF